MQEAADEIQRLRDALGKIERHGPIMGSTGDYRQGQIDILETVSTIAGLALCANSSDDPRPLVAVGSGRLFDGPAKNSLK